MNTREIIKISTFLTSSESHRRFVFSQGSARCFLARVWLSKLKMQKETQKEIERRAAVQLQASATGTRPTGLSLEGGALPFAPSILTAPPCPQPGPTFAIGVASDEHERL